eukprot:TRINITY_DN16569_c0_g4_i8.p1 TRINITY_DN16569_c0_g4~~TRINITY_DN16569_c0_g4_i8.p1  ORF type:complete len:373 (+),score=82.68 TRINITY_DN16569_c0_g4_i8:49-1167(+)
MLGYGLWVILDKASESRSLIRAFRPIPRHNDTLSCENLVQHPGDKQASLVMIFTAWKNQGNAWTPNNLWPGDLEALQRLRDLKRLNTPKPDTSLAAKKEDKKDMKLERQNSGDRKAGGLQDITSGEPQEVSAEEEPDPDILKLMDLSPELLWQHLGRSNHRDAMQLLFERMEHDTLPMSITGHEAARAKVDEPKPATKDFLAAVQACLADAEADKAAAVLEAAKLFAVRSLATGKATSLPSALALRLFLNDDYAQGLHRRVNAALQALASAAPLSTEMEKIAPFVAQLEIALRALPAERGTQFLGLNISTPSGKLTEALNGDKGIGSFYPGGLVLWKGIASVTADPMLAKEAAFRGPGCALVLKLRSTTSRT